MFSWSSWNAALTKGGGGDDSSASSSSSLGGRSEAAAWCGGGGGLPPLDHYDHPHQYHNDDENDDDALPLLGLLQDNHETPGTLRYFRQFQNDLRERLRFPAPSSLPPVWTECLQTWQASKTSLERAQQFLNDELNRHDDNDDNNGSTPRDIIEQAQQAVQRAQAALQANQDLVQMVGESLLGTTTTTPTTAKDDGESNDKSNGNDNDVPSIPEFLSDDFVDRFWVTFVVLQDPQHWATWCCTPTTTTTTTTSGTGDNHHHGHNHHHHKNNKIATTRDDDETPDPTRVAMALHFLLHNVPVQRWILGEGAGGPRGGNYGGYLEIASRLDSSSSLAAGKEPVLQRLAQAVALEFADADHCYWDGTTTDDPIDPVARYLHYEQAYLLGDLDPAFSTLTIWELRLAVRSTGREEELEWGRACLTTYRPDLALTDDSKWRYCFLVRSDVAYTSPTWTSRPHTMDQILSGGGKCGPRAWFGRFICQAFGIPVWGVRQSGHAAMSHWTEQGWTTCLGAGWPWVWWPERDGRNRCGVDFYLETRARASLPSPTAYLQRVMRLEWLANYQKESNASILKDCSYDPSAPWHALSLAQRYLVSKENDGGVGGGVGPRETFYAPSTIVVPKIRRVIQAAAPPQTKSLAIVCNNGICIPADTTTTKPSKNLVLMPSFTGGRQVFLGKDGVVEFKLEPHWLPVQSRAYHLTVKVATAHQKDTALLVTVTHKKTNAKKNPYRLPLPYSKGLWQETESVEIPLGPGDEVISFQREWNELFGIAIKEIRLTPC